MRLTRLSLAGFRNLRDQSLDLPASGVALVGENAQGKSNVLEAIHYLETFRSFRGSRDEALVRFGDDAFRVAGTLSSGEEVSAAFERSTGRKRVALDGEAVPRLGDAIGRLGTVLFTPDDVALVSAGPHERRRFLDILLSLNEPGYLPDLQRYRQAHARRNAVLREGGAPALVAAWNGELTGAGARVTRARAAWLAEAAPAFEAYCREISGGGRTVLRYRPGIPGVSDPGPVEAVERAFREALERTREGERRRGATLAGPHRDEVRFHGEALEGERDLREFGSGGQRRTAALALRLVEADTVRSRRGREPLLLLDDVLAELDEDRSGRVLELLERSVPGQVILTAPREGDVRFRREALPRWTIRGGQVAP